jgi:hypothetical protein
MVPAPAGRTRPCQERWLGLDRAQATQTREGSPWTPERPSISFPKTDATSCGKTTRNELRSGLDVTSPQQRHTANDVSHFDTVLNGCGTVRCLAMARAAPDTREPQFGGPPLLPAGRSGA